MTGHTHTDNAVWVDPCATITARLYRGRSGPPHDLNLCIRFSDPECQGVTEASFWIDYDQLDKLADLLTQAAAADIQPDGARDFS